MFGACIMCEVDACASVCSVFLMRFMCVCFMSVFVRMLAFYEAVCVRFLCVYLLDFLCV